MKSKKKKKISFNKLLNGNNRCTIKKCSKNVQKILDYLKKNKIKLDKLINKKSQKKMQKDYISDIEIIYSNLLDKLAKRKYYKQYLKCICCMCAKQFRGIDKETDDIINILDITPIPNKHFKLLLNKSILLSKKLTENIANQCKINL
jgi:hypothetical protein